MVAARVVEMVAAKGEVRVVVRAAVMVVVVMVVAVQAVAMAAAMEVAVTVVATAGLQLNHQRNSVLHISRTLHGIRICAHCCLAQQRAD